MGKYFVYYCSISEIDTIENTVTPVFQANSENDKIHSDKDAIFRELRDIFDRYCAQSKINDATSVPL
jgi:hypothetical protein